MRKNLLAVFCVLTIFASTAPIFAADTTTTTPVVLSMDQLAKLDAAQMTLNDLITKIEGLKTTYAGKKNTKGLLTSLNQFEKQANKLNTAITNYRKNPTASADQKMQAFQHKTKILGWKVTVTEKILNKITTPKKLHPIKKPVKPIKPIIPVHPIDTTTEST